MRTADPKARGLGRIGKKCSQRCRTTGDDRGRQRTTEPYDTFSALLRRAEEAPTLNPRGTIDNHSMEKKRPVSHPEKIIRLKTVLLRTGLSRSTLYRKIADGTFPRQLPISINGAGWHESAVDRWIADPGGYRASDSERATR